LGGNARTLSLSWSSKFAAMIFLHFAKQLGDSIVSWQLQCAMVQAGLAHIDAVLEHGDLANYYLAHSARADMYRRLGKTAEARTAYEKALALTQQEPERQFLQERIRQLK
jgi:predicted negative regulator of RcsB-dependent stress response